MAGFAEKNDFTIEDADPYWLKVGTVVEMEHTDDPAVAQQIALDHLAEHPDYYILLNRMEQWLKVHG